MGGACSTYVASSSVYRLLVGKLEVKRPLGRPSLGWEYNIKMVRQEVLRGARNASSWLKIGTVGGHL